MNSGYKRKSGALRILVLGYIIRGPLGGMTWHYLQYVLGLRQMGHDVYFLEDSGDTIYACYDPVRHVVDTDAAYGLQYAWQVFRKVGLEDRWAYYNHHLGKWQGPLAEKVKATIASADILLNLSGANPIRPWLARVPIRVLIDTDPVFTQIDNLTNPGERQFTAQHNAFFTFGANIGKADCRIPDDGFPWQATRQPIYLNAWKISPSRPTADWTTVMQCDSYQVRVFNGLSFGMKSLSFAPFTRLPQLIADETFELALGSASAPTEQLRSNGWHIISSLIPTKTPWSYQEYIQRSKGEWSAAKHGYVVSNSGWFSERSACYLASGKPVVVQETGFSQDIETGKGLFSFTTVAEAVDRIQQLNEDYDFHCQKARQLVEENFEATRVLKALLDKVS